VGRDDRRHGASATWGTVRHARLAPAWQTAPGLLLIGEIRVRGRQWARPPRQPAALEVTREIDGDTHFHRLTAVFAGGRRDTMFDDRRLAGSALALGAWLAARAGLPFADHTQPRPGPAARPPGARPRARRSRG